MSYFKLEKEDNNLFFMEIDYDEDNNWRDLLCIMLNDSNKGSYSYELHRCTIPKEMGMINIIGVDIL